MNNTITTNPGKLPEYPTDLEVEQIRKVIKQGDDALLAFRKSATDRIKSGIEFGNFCIKWKPRMRGHWERWADETFPGVSKIWRCRLMRLARHVGKHGAGCLKNAKYITNALHLTDTLPKPPPRVVVRGSPTPAQVAQELVKRIRHWHPNKLTPEKRAELKAALKPVVELYGRL